MDADTQTQWLALASLRLSPRHLSKRKDLGLEWSFLMGPDAQTRQHLAAIGFSLERYQPIRVRTEMAEKLSLWCQEEGWTAITYESPLYPSLLKEIADAPPVLFCKGDVQLLSAPQLAIVGSRNSSAYGDNLASEFARDLCRKGVCITSGLALGIDRAAHLGALKVSGSTIAVMATGPDRIYPTQNQSLASQLVQAGGLILTEKLPGTQPKPYLFPERNRLISGLSLGTLVVEGNLKSGSLITARMALEEGREVMAVPGALTNPRARGCHRLIQQGAALVESTNDILKVLYPSLKSFVDINLAEPQVSVTPDEPVSPILKALAVGGLSMDQLIEQTGLGISELSFRIAELEMSGWLAKQGARYTRLK